MDFANGGNLFDKIDQNLNENDILIILVQLLNGLKYLHFNNIFHPHFKPENILLMKNGEIKICDFGFDEYIQTSTASEFGFDNDQLNSNREIYFNQHLGKARDIWSVGILIYLLATNKLQYFSNDHQQLNLLIANSEFPSIGNNFTLNLKHILSMMLDKSPQNRPSASQLIESIKQNFPFINLDNPLQSLPLNSPILPLPIPQVIPARLNQISSTKEKKNQNRSSKSKRLDRSNSLNLISSSLPKQHNIFCSSLVVSTKRIKIKYTNSGTLK